jgi:hypothetical protein
MIQIGSNSGTQLGPNFGILEPIFLKIIVLGKKGLEARFI